MSFYEQLEKLCTKNGVKPSNVVESLGMSKGTMSNWKKGGTPSGEAVVRFAKHFGVSTDYLLLGVETFPTIPPDDAEWLSLIHQLPVEAQYEFRGEIKGYLKRLNEESTVAGQPLKQAK